MLKGRIVKLQMLEKFIFSRSCIDLENPNELVHKLNVGIGTLDREWFNFMPSTFFVSKYKEELQEFKDALLAFYSNKKRMTNPEIVESMFYSVVAELSDVLLAASSALNENKIEEEVVISDFKGLLTYSLELSDRFGEDVIFTKITPELITEFHVNKVREMFEAKAIYEECIYTKEDSKWFKLLLKLHTLPELLDPNNKMKIVKEIRRMKYAIENIDN